MPDLLSADDIKNHLGALPGWHLEKGEITRTIELASFPAAVLFVGAVGHIAEAAGHHPDIVIKYRKVTLSLVSHDAGGLTEADFSLATRIDHLIQGA